MKTICGMCSRFVPSYDYKPYGICREWLFDLENAVTTENDQDASECEFFAFGATLERMRELSDRYGVELDD